MPSDCQCSVACAVEVREIVKVINNKEATKKLSKLEKEVKTLKSQNSELKFRLERATVNKDQLIKKIKSKLNSI